MNQAKTFPGTSFVSSLLDERRSENRYHCCVKALCKPGTVDSREHQDETWCIGRIVDISMRGIALLIQRRPTAGGMLTFVPLIPSWKPEWQLVVRVTHLQPDAEHGWCAGCEFSRPLTDEQLNVFLRNST
jgi:PilZ domain